VQDEPRTVDRPLAQWQTLASVARRLGRRVRTR